MVPIKIKMKSRLQTLRAALLLGAAILIAPSVPAQAVNAGGATLRYQILGSTDDMLFRVMEAKNFCEKFGLKCHGVRITNGPLGMQAMLGNSIEVSYTTTDAALRAIDGGAKVKVVMGVDNRSPFYVVTRTDLKWPNQQKGYPALMQDFKGKRIGVTGRGAGTELIFDLLLQGAGLSPEDVTFVAVGGPPTTFGSLTAKQIDAASAVPPTAEICEHSTVCKAVLNLSAEKNIPVINALAGTAVVALMSDDYIEKNPKVVAAFLAAGAEASLWIKDPANFEEYYAIGKKFVPLTIPNGDVILREALGPQRRITDSRISLSAVQAYIATLHKAKLTHRTLKPNDVIARVAPTY